MTTPKRLYVDFVGGIPVAVAPSQHWYDVGAVDGIRVAIVSPTDPPPPHGPPRLLIQAALEFAKQQTTTTTTNEETN